jgi:endonuclease/exonuclease/phosphatase family metal-dependent hydrolase
MKVLSWNVNGRVRDAARRQIEEVLGRDADVICLQELRRNSLSLWLSGLNEAGYSEVETVDLLDAPYPGNATTRTYFNLTAARHPIQRLPGLNFDDPEEADVAFPEKYLAARVQLNGLEIDVHNAHLPPGATRGAIKVHAFEAIRRRVDERAGHPTVLCGDFNTPAAEDAAAITPSGDGQPEPLRTRWMAAEMAILDHGSLRDVYREIHQRDTPFPTSHVTSSGPKRYDHIYASPEFETKGCKYLTGWLQRRLSDHAAVEAELELPCR